MVATGVRRRRALYGSLGTKLVLAVVAIVALSSTLLYLVLVERERDGLLQAKQRAANKLADLFAASLSAPLDFDDTEAVGAQLEELGTDPEVTCAAVWRDGARAPLGVLHREACPELGGSDDRIDGLHTSRDGVEVIHPVIAPTGVRVGRTLIVLALRANQAAFEETRIRLLALSALPALAITALLLLLVRGQIVVPIAELAGAARRLGEGDREARVATRSNDEIGELGAAFNGMADAIAEHERQIEAATQSLRELLDNMRQAIVAFDERGAVVGAVSREARALFGEGFEAGTVGDLLYPAAPPGAARAIERQAFDEWLALAFQIPPSSWGEIARLAPRDVVLHRADAARTVEVEFRPISRDGAVVRVMMLATDVSEQRDLRKRVETQEELYERRMAAMRRLVTGGGQVFVRFLDGATQRIARSVRVLDDGGGKIHAAQVDELFRHAHTLKGEARAFALSDLEAAAERIEEELDAIRRDDPAAQRRGFAIQALYGHLAAAQAAVAEGREVFVAASPIGEAALDQITVRRADVDALLALAPQLDASGAAGLRAAQLTRRLAARPFGESTTTLADAAPTWGEEHGKKLRVEIEGRDVPVPPALARVLSPVLVHLVRNAVAHGIEAPAQREALGKPATGVVRIEATSAERGPTIVVEDDGRGLDDDAIRKQARSLGADARAAPATQLVFASGLTTLSRAGSLAGRGVGLSAVRAELAEVGYDVVLSSQPNVSTRVTLAPRKIAPRTSPARS